MIEEDYFYTIVIDMRYKDMWSIISVLFMRQYILIPKVLGRIYICNNLLSSSSAILPNFGRLKFRISLIYQNSTHNFGVIHVQL
jgi:hypothetical protein